MGSFCKWHEYALLAVVLLLVLGESGEVRSSVGKPHSGDHEALALLVSCDSKAQCKEIALVPPYRHI